MCEIFFYAIKTFKAWTAITQLKFCFSLLHIVVSFWKTLDRQEFKDGPHSKDMHMADPSVIGIFSN